MNYYEITMERTSSVTERATFMVAARSMEEAVFSAHEASPEWVIEHQTPDHPEIIDIERTHTV